MKYFVFDSYDITSGGCTRFTRKLAPLRFLTFCGANCSTGLFHISALQLADRGQYLLETNFPVLFAFNMAEEEDPKEYRWETGYERTWSVFLNFQFQLKLADAISVQLTIAGNRSKKMTKDSLKVPWPRSYKRQNVSVK